MLGYFLDTKYLSYTCLSNCLSLECYDTDINPKLLLLSSLTVMILAIIGNEQITNILLVVVQIESEGFVSERVVYCFDRNK